MNNELLEALKIYCEKNKELELTLKERKTDIEAKKDDIIKELYMEHGHLNEEEKEKFVKKL